MKMLKEILAFLRGGTAGLNAIETCLVLRAIGKLPSHEAFAVRSQLDLISLVQRPQPGRMSIAFYARTPPLLDNSADEACLAEVTYGTENGRRFRVRLMTHDGYLQSIEGHIPRKMEELRDVSVRVWPNVKSITPQAIHRLEHGRDKGC